jgi:beta-lactamase regulating signal transducer with metallopeptidase domain
MTPSPVVEVALVVAAGVTAAWLMSYLAHSTLLVASGALMTRLVRLAPVDAVWVWRFAIVVPFGSATLQTIGLAGGGLGTPDISQLAPAALVDWRAGAIVILLIALVPARLLSGWIRGWIARRRAFGERQPAPPELQRELDAISALADARPLRLTISETALVPAAVGLAEVCLPAHLARSMAAEVAAERRALLAHEAGHLVRRDPLWTAIVGHLARLAPFQPLNRWVLARLRQSSEEAADDFAVSATGGDAAVLARALASLTAALVPESGGVAATSSPVVSRVRRLLDDTRPRPRPGHRRIRIAAGAAVVGVTLTLTPGVTADVDRVAARLSWLAPSREDPNPRMLEVRRVTREWRRALRQLF